MKKLSLFVILLFISASFTAFFAQPPTPPENSATAQTKGEKSHPVEDDEVLRFETNLVSIPVKVLDRSGKFIAGLKKDDFRIFEDDAEQEIAYFSNVEEPFTVVLVLDMSYSTVFKTAEIQRAAIAFTAQLRPKDKVMVVSFDQEVHLLCEPTTDRKESTRAIKSTQVGTGTSLYEAVDFVINKKLRQIEGRKAIVLFTDGVDTTSEKAGLEKNIREAEELDAIIYPIQYDTYRDVQKTRMPVQFPIPPTQTSTNPTFGQNPAIVGAGTTSGEYETANLYLRKMADGTGGRVLPALDKSSMALAFSKIADELRQTYSLGFYPKEEKLEKKRKLKVRVAQKGVVVRARESYTVSKKAKKDG